MQLDMFRNSTDDFLYGEIQKIRNSMDRRSRAMFAIITEMQDALLKIQEKEKKEGAPNENAL